MAESAITREDFLMEVAPEHQEFAAQTIAYMQENGCTLKIEAKKSGSVVSFVHNASKRTIANFVFRKGGLVVRLYADNIGKYPDLPDSAPDGLAKDIAKSTVCKRLLNPDDCNSRCPMGYSFSLRGKEQKKCRYGAFMLKVNDENIPFITNILQSETAARNA